jgi:hypothetical protein
MANYRSVYKSDHLGVIDLEELIENGKQLIFTIKEVKQELGVFVAGNRGNFNITYFKENIKPLVLNATNANTVRKLAGGSTNTDNWNNILVELYIDNSVKMKGQIVGGVRIKTQKPIIDKINITDKQAIEILNTSKNAEQLKNNWFSLSKEEKEMQTVLTLKDSLKAKFENDSKI